MKLNFKRLCSALLPLTLTACMVGPDFSRPTAKVQDQYKQPEKSEFTEAIQSSSDRLLNPVTWWSGFKDPTLNKLLAQAAGENLTLQRAALRIYQARSQLGVADATLLPTVNLGGSASRTQQPSALPIFGSESTTSNAQALLAQANWEIDFWGKYRRGIESTLATYASTVATYYAADVSLASEVANTYINIRNYESLLDVAKTNLALQAESLRIAGSRFKNGATSQLDLSQAQSQYEQTKADIP
ncbi:MAG TPA: transporter, partial [Alcaligenaceae bacterium]|nr:transporter [Alcaligenaceae bacterium]